MRAHSTIISRRRRKARRRRALALAFGVCALAIPASASAEPSTNDYSSVNAINGGPYESIQPEMSTTEGTSAHGRRTRAGQYAPAAQGHPRDGIDEPSGLAHRTPTELAQRSATGSDTGDTSLNAITGPTPDAPTFVTGGPTGTGEGFDWASAAVGAGAAMALVALGGAALLTVRRRTTISPSASAN
jgi:hypothetical protein